MKNIFLVISTVLMLTSLYGCGVRLKAEFSPFRPLPPEALKVKNASEITIMSDRLPTDKPYIELGYITVDESGVSPIFTLNVSDGDIVRMVKEKAAEYGADAVIEFSISGKHPYRKAKGIAIIFKQR